MSRERILVAGAPGSGKSYQLLTIARALPQSTFHIIDPDDGVVRLWDSEFPELTNIRYYFTPTWYGIVKCSYCGKEVKDCRCKEEKPRFVGGVANSLTDIRKHAKPDDWVGIEMLNNLWSMAQSGFVAEVFEEGIGEYFLKARKELKEGSKRLDALKGWTDWQVINKMHNDDFLVSICYQLPVHVYMSTTFSLQSSQDASSEEAEQKAFYGDTSIRLEGQKHNPFRAQSIFLFVKGRDGWTFSTFLKDRGRKWVEKEQLFDFGLQYVSQVAGLGE